VMERVGLKREEVAVAPGNADKKEKTKVK